MYVVSFQRFCSLSDSDDKLQNTEPLTDMDHLRALLILARTVALTKERAHSALTNRSVDVTANKLDCMLPVARCPSSSYILARCREAQFYDFPIPLSMIAKTNGMHVMTQCVRLYFE